MIDNVSAIFVDPRGPYPGLLTDWWDEKRDARRYAGPNPVVAHPPCKRWGRWWYSDGSAKPGQDGGLFASAWDSVRRFGGVLEHPAHSHAWASINMPAPADGAGWYRTGRTYAVSEHSEEYYWPEEGEDDPYPGESRPMTSFPMSNDWTRAHERLRAFHAARSSRITRFTAPMVAPESFCEGIDRCR